MLGEVPTSHYVMGAVQVKELAFSFDGILVPENGEGTICFLEVQFYDDPAFYPRLFGEVFLHLSDRYRGAKKSDAETLQEVRIVMIYPERRENEEVLWTTPHRDALAWPSVERIYIDEIPQTDNLYTEVIRLVIAPAEEIAQEVARLRGLPEVEGSMLDILQDMIIKKLTQLSPEEVTQMLGLTDTKIEDTRYYKDVFGKGATQTEERLVVNMLQAGMSVEQVTESTKLPIDKVRAVWQKGQTS